MKNHPVRIEKDFLKIKHIYHSKEKKSNRQGLRSEEGEERVEGKREEEGKGGDGEEGN